MIRLWRYCLCPFYVNFIPYIIVAVIIERSLRLNKTHTVNVQ